MHLPARMEAEYRLHIGFGRRSHTLQPFQLLSSALGIPAVDTGNVFTDVFLRLFYLLLLGGIPPYIILPQMFFLLQEV